MELKVEGLNLKIRKSWEQKIAKEQERLDRHHPGLIQNLRVTVETTQHQKAGGYEVRLIAGVPNETVVVKRKGESVSPLLVDAFDTLGLQLKELQRKRQRSSQKQDVGVTAAGCAGVIKKLSPFESYGFIFDDDGRDIYFHENALKNLSMDEIKEGDSVIFGETSGDKGPQASWVKVL